MTSLSLLFFKEKHIGPWAVKDHVANTKTTLPILRHELEGQHINHSG